MTDMQKAEALALYYDVINDAREHAGEVIVNQGGAREGDLHKRLTHKFAVAFVACEMFVDDSEIEALLAEDRRNAAVADGGPASDPALAVTEVES